MFSLRYTAQQTEDELVAGASFAADCAARPSSTNGVASGVRNDKGDYFSKQLEALNLEDAGPGPFSKQLLCDVMSEMADLGQHEPVFIHQDRVDTNGTIVFSAFFSRTRQSESPIAAALRARSTASGSVLCSHPAASEQSPESRSRRALYQRWWRRRRRRLFDRRQLQASARQSRRGLSLRR